MTEATGRRALTSGQVAELFGVEAKTVARWANEGRLPYFRTPGGHRRFPYDEVIRFTTPEGRRSSWQSEI